LSTTVAVIVVDRNARAVDGKLFEVDSLSVDLSVQVGEQTTLKQRIFTEVYASHDVSWLETDRFSLSKVVCWISIQGHLSENAHTQVGILSVDGLSFFPQKTCSALLGLPMPSDELTVSFFGNHAHGVNTEAAHVAV
ncbi:hypothetical protein KCU81_g455, partial [Aureobasidium melanogenum]